MRVAVLDLGSNSFTLLVAEVFSDGTLVQLARERESVQLGARIAEHGHIDQEGWRRAMVAMAGLVGQARMSGATRILVLATGALRDAENGAALLRAAGRELEVETAILSPEVAARLAFLGVRAELPALFGRLAVVDVGGGSIEIAVGETDASLFTCSLPLGIQRVRAAMATEGRDEVLASLRSALAPAARAVRGFQPQRVVFASGTARAVYRLVRRRRSVGVGEGWMDRAALHRVAQWASAASIPALEEAGVRDDRLRTIPISAAVLDLMAEMFDASELWVSRCGLREGAILDEMRRWPVPEAGRTPPTAEL